MEQTKALTHSAQMQGARETPMGDIFTSVRHAASAMFNQRTRDLTKNDELKEHAQKLTNEVSLIQNCVTDLSSHQAAMDAVLEESQQLAKARMETLSELNSTIVLVTKDQQLCSRLYQSTENAAQLIHCFISEVCTSKTNVRGTHNLHGLIEKGRVLTNGRSYVEFRQLGLEVRRRTAVVKDHIDQMCRTGILSGALLDSCKEWHCGAWKNHPEMESIRQRLEALEQLQTSLNEEFGSASHSKESGMRKHLPPPHSFEPQFQLYHSIWSKLTCIPRLPENDDEVQFFDEVKKSSTNFSLLVAPAPVELPIITSTLEPENTTAPSIEEVGGQPSVSLPYVGTSDNHDEATDSLEKASLDVSSDATGPITFPLASPAALFRLTCTRTACLKNVVDEIHAQCATLSICADSSTFITLQTETETQSSTMEKEFKQWVKEVQTLQHKRCAYLVSQTSVEDLSQARHDLQEQLKEANKKEEELVCSQNRMEEDIHQVFLTWKRHWVTVSEKRLLLTSLNEELKETQTQASTLRHTVTELEQRTEELRSADPEAESASRQLVSDQSIIEETEAQLHLFLEKEKQMESSLTRVKDTQDTVREALLPSAPEQCGTTSIAIISEIALIPFREVMATFQSDPSLEIGALPAGNPNPEDEVTCAPLSFTSTALTVEPAPNQEPKNTLEPIIEALLASVSNSTDVPKGHASMCDAVVDSLARESDLSTESELRKCTELLKSSTWVNIPADLLKSILLCILTAELEFQVQQKELSIALQESQKEIQLLQRELGE